MLKVDARLFSSFSIVFLLIFYVAESNCRANPPKDGQASVDSKFDPDEPPETTIRLAPFLMFGGQIELEYGLERNLDLDRAQDEDLSTLEPGLTLAFSFEPSEYLHSFFNVKLGWELFLDEEVKKDDKAVIEVEQAYLSLRGLFGGRLSFQVGRQRYDDERQWLYDEELDAARSFYKFTDFSIELSASRKNLADRDLLNPDKGERINNYVINGIYKHEEEERETIAAAYVFARDDRSDKEESPVFLGIHGEGDANDNLGYWLELAYVMGKEGSDKIRGFGFDLGSTYVLDLPLEPSVTLGYAFGTGDDDPDDGTEKSFRQTGLQNNEGSFNGVPDFKYYGELFDPALSNLQVFTAGAGINLTEASSIDLVYHSYLQHKASDSLPGTGIDATPDGRNKGLGNEIDLVIGYEGTNKLELGFKLGYFIPGKAFSSDSDNSFLTKIEIQYEF